MLLVQQVYRFLFWRRKPARDRWAATYNRSSCRNTHNKK